MAGIKLFNKRQQPKDVNANAFKKSTGMIATTSKAGSTAHGKFLDAVLDNRSEAASSTDEETLTLESSSCCRINHGLLIAPIPRRTEVFDPPKSMFDGIPKHYVGKKSKSIKKLMPWKRNRSAKSSISSQSSFTVQSPCIDKKRATKLSPTLKSIGQVKGSAWQIPTLSSQLQPSVNDSDKDTIAPPSVVEMNVPLSSSDSFTLPVVISPAYKFVPIGYSSDEDEVSFHSADYDICKSNSDDSIDKFSFDMKEKSESRMKEMGMSKSFGAEQTEECSDTKVNQSDAEKVIDVKTEDDLTPFEEDLKTASQPRDELNDSVHHLFEARSSSSLDLINEEFSLVSIYKAEPTNSQSSDNEECKQSEGHTKHSKHNSGDVWSLVEKITSLLTCGATSTY